MSSETLAISGENDIVRVRQAVRRGAVELHFSLTEQTKIVTAASEIARNTLIYGLGGNFVMSVVNQEGKNGLRLEFIDEGPGIADLEIAMRDGYSSGSGLGFGLSGSRRLVDDFAISSEPGKGTRVTLVRWK